MSARANSVPGDTEGRRKTFLEWTSINLSSKLSLTCRGNINYNKSVHYPILALKSHFQNKSVSSLFNWMCKYVFFSAKVKEEERPFLEGARRGATLWDYPQEHLVAIRNEESLLVRNLKNPIPPLFLIKLPYN